MAWFHVCDSWQIDLLAQALCHDQLLLASEGPTSTECPAVFLIYILVFWLHSQWHLPFRACNALLTVLTLIFHMLEVHLDPPIVTSLPGVISALDAEPKFQTLPVCPSCFRVFPATLPDPALCSHCDTSLFVTTATPAEQQQGRATRRVRKPLLRFPFKSLQDQLSDMLQVLGMEELCDQWCQKTRQPGVFQDIFDGNVIQELVAPDNSPFFGPIVPSAAPPELHIGVSLGVDWFSYLRSQIAPSHTSCPMSFNVVNLPLALRYRISNLLLVGIMPGPKEAGLDQVQYFLRVIINELLRLWRDGFVIKTSAFPNGHRVQVILVGVICDKPAAHKLAKFALKATLDAFLKDAFARHTNAQHRAHMERYKDLDHAARWSELARLLYFDICHMVVVDPIHNLFLDMFINIQATPQLILYTGLVKSHFYHIWVRAKVLRTTCELCTFHALLADLELPARLGRLPSLIGEPAGGSLTADQWLLLATVVGTLLLPQIWQDYGILNQSVEQLAHHHSAIEKTLAQRRKKKQAGANHKSADVAPSKKRRKTAQSTQASEHSSAPRPREMELESDDAGAAENNEDAYSGPEAESEGETDHSMPYNMHPGDLSNFLKLARALRIFLQDQINASALKDADRFIREYCSELLSLYGSAVIRPNHHYATHTAECINDYGPLREFWTFIFEWMNKVLKSYRTDNHAGGELECSFLREFFRTLAQASRQAPASSALTQAINTMFKASSNDHGTLQALAQEVDEQTEDAMLNLNLSPRYSAESLPQHVYFAFLHYLRKARPGLIFHSMIALNTNPDSVRVQDRALLFDYVVVNGKHFYASSHSSKRAESLIAI
ncbi:hypothetical protein OBBRIDRAFT_851644 [Obba rivulosa]|uniref:Uncharacterized protein n=1 Tax=Obba rivulosa TaxID=1052685 RepID=A0A8E2DHI3_9APHY|nr:hypothetical protein OBBRIDRAFT_851644 [Obba rivulosa]